MPHDHSKAVETEAAKKKKHLVIIALLLAGLLVAIWTQPAKDTQETSVSVTPIVLKAIDGKSPETDDEPREIITSIRELSRRELDSIVQTRLFYVPESESADEQQVAEEKQEVAEVTVQAIYGHGKLTKNSQSQGHRVLIGRAIIRSGQVLPDGRQVVRVTPDGVELAQ